MGYTQKIVHRSILRISGVIGESPIEESQKRGYRGETPI